MGRPSDGLSQRCVSRFISLRAPWVSRILPPSLHRWRPHARENRHTLRKREDLPARSGGGDQPSGRRQDAEAVRSARCVDAPSGTTSPRSDQSRGPLLSPLPKGRQSGRTKVSQPVLGLPTTSSSTCNREGGRVAVPKTVLLPHKQHPPNTGRVVLNWSPVDWRESSRSGFPIFMKPPDGGGWRDVYKVNDRTRFSGLRQTHVCR